MAQELYGKWLERERAHSIEAADNELLGMMLRMDAKSAPDK